ncbi:MAG: MerR family transcriptional regulator [Defluviitaleaceae bacterium]|nr:MerR family transcriptional regulator [Defluviitaleaceae bacterium]
MEYTVNKLAKIAGISTRTLRYYDQLGLLCPERANDNGYRAYGQKEVDRLQHILFYRELGVPLDDIKKILSEGEFDGAAALEGHLVALCTKRRQLDILIFNVEKSILAMKGEIDMNDNEKFEGFVENVIKENEAAYGEEIRGKYGDAMIDASNEKLRGMDAEEFALAEKLSDEVNDALAAAFATGDIKGELARKAVELHKQWLCVYWRTYSKEAHVGVAQMYADDERFMAYYDRIAVGCAVFLRDAVVDYYS